MTVYNFFYIATNIIYIFSVYKLFNLFFKSKTCNILMRNIILILYFLTISTIIFFTRVPIIMTIIGIFFFFLLSLSYKSSLQKKLLSVSLIYSIGVVIELVVSAAFGFLDFSPTQNSTFNSVSILIFVRVITLVISYLLNRYVTSLKSDYIIPPIYYLGFCLVLFGSLYLFIAQLFNENITMNMLFISGSVLIIVNVIMIVMDEKIYHLIILENKNKLLQQQTIAYENQMEIINQSNEAIRLLRHNYKDHLIMLSNLYDNGKQDEAKEYINTIIGNMGNESVANSNNFVIDSVLNFKLRNIKNTNINLTLLLNVPISINILPYDLTVVIGNLLDNAILASNNSIEKILSIKIECQMNNLIILIDNSYNGKIIDDNGIFKTTKLYKNNHGLGITSVKKIIEKYDGDIRFNYTSNMFSVSVIIPY